MQTGRCGAEPGREPSPAARARGRSRWPFGPRGAQRGSSRVTGPTVQMGTRPEGRRSAPRDRARIRPFPPPLPSQHLRPHQLPLRLGAGEGGLPALVLQAVWRGGLQLLGPHRPAGGRGQAHLRLGPCPGGRGSPSPPEVLPEPTSWGFLAPSQHVGRSGLSHSQGTQVPRPQPSHVPRSRIVRIVGA